MSRYLTIAEKILEEAKRPLSARAILRIAYVQGMMPADLYGRTQHKTLQARLSEDILHRRNHSAFFRTRPGQFFLRRYLTDPTLPAEFRVPMIARRRTRDLLEASALSVDASCVDLIAEENKFPQYKKGGEFLGKCEFAYVDPRRMPVDRSLVWALATVMKDGFILAYRMGRYRDDRDDFASKRSIYFSTLVSEDARTLFNPENFGIADSALAAAGVDLDIPPDLCQPNGGEFKHALRYLIVADTSPSRELLAVVEIDAPAWFEPTVRRLSVNHLHWIDLSTRINNIEDFDPWSQQILSVMTA